MSDTPRTDAAHDPTAPEKLYWESRQLERELAESQKDTARMDWIRRNCEIHYDQGASTRIIEELCEIDAAIPLDQWDRDNIDDEINREEKQND